MAMAEVDPAPEGVETDAMASAPDASAKGKKLVRLDKPDRAAFDATAAKLQANLDRYTARVAAIKDTIELKRDNRKHVSSASAMHKTRMQELTQAFKQRMDERNAIREELLAADAARERLREESRALRDRLPYSRVEDIDNEIARLEGSIAHTTMSLNEEKKMMTRIKELTKSREAVKDYHDRNAKINEEEAYRKAIIERIRAKDLEINAVKAEQQQLRGMLETTRSKEDAEVADVPALQAERQKMYDLIKETRETLRSNRLAFKAKEDEYYQNERALKAQLREQRQKEWEERQEERKRRAEARKKFEKENAVEPYTDQVIMCEQLIAYLGKYVTEDEPSTSGAAPAGKGAVKPGKKGFDDEDVFAVSGKGKKGKKGKGGGAKEAAPQKLTHGMDTLASYATVGLTPPPTTAGAKASIEELKAKKAHYLELRASEKAKQEAEEKAAAENGDKKAPAEDDADAAAPALVAVAITGAADGTVSVALTPAAEA